MSEPLTARAVFYRKLGGEEAVEIDDRGVRPPGPGEVRIQVHAAAVSPTDVLLRDPGLDGVPLPVTPGMDAAGIIEAVGPDVSRLRVGDAVMAAVKPVRPEGGAQASYLVVPAASAVPIPAGSTLAQASTLPMNGLTALLALELAGLRQGQTLAVSGGAGLLASYAIAIAHHQGIKIIADAKAGEIELVRGHGAELVVERSDDFAGAVRRALPDGVDALLDTALLDAAAFPALRDGGVYLPVRGWTKPPAERGIQIKPIWVYEVLERTEWLEQLRGLVESGVIELRVAGEYPLDRVAEAQRVLGAGGVRGRPVIVFQERGR